MTSPNTPDLFIPAWKEDVDQQAERYLREIHEMAESARRSIGQRHRRNREMVVKVHTE